MAVIPQKRKDGTTVYYVTTYVPEVGKKGKTHWENAGTDKRAAERLDAKHYRELAAGTFAAAQQSGMTFGDFLRGWLKERDTRNNDGDENLVKLYILSRDWLADLPLEDIKASHGLRLVEELKKTMRQDGSKTLSEKYVSNLYGLYTSAIRTARAQDLISVDPCVLPRGKLRRKAKRGARRPYEMGDICALTVDAPLSEGSVFAALNFFTGFREGEACGRRWRDIDPHAKPLAAIDVSTQYDDQPLKTDDEDAGAEHARKVPLHPVLAKILDAWWREGFEWTYARKPTVDDFIVPRTTDGKNHTKSSGYKLWRAHVESRKVTNLSLHSTRHTFITQCRRGGAARDVLEKVTHNAEGAVIDTYTHFDWDPLCQQVLFFRIPQVEAQIDAGEKPAAEEWRRRESNRALGTGERGNARKNSEESAHASDRENTEEDHKSTPTIARLNGSRQSRTRSGSESFRPLPAGVQNVVTECLSRAIPLVHAGDVGALTHLERAAAAIDGAVQS